MKTMKKTSANSCEYCDGRLKERTVRVVRSRGARMVVIEKVPARVCDRCGMRYYAGPVVRQMDAILKKRKQAKRTLKVPVAEYEKVM